MTNYVCMCLLGTCANKIVEFETQERRSYCLLWISVPSFNIFSRSTLDTVNCEHYRSMITNFFWPECFDLNINITHATLNTLRVGMYEKEATGALKTNITQTDVPFELCFIPPIMTSIVLPDKLCFIKT